MANIENTYNYGRQKLWQAVHSLATGTGNIQERLESAMMGLNGLQSNQEWLPVEVRHKLEAIIQELTRTPAQGSEGRIKATLRMMSNEEGSELAGRIFSLYIELRGGI
ncbi:hypothetical protein [Granulicella mallensis]|uniref:Uncharacterized protein n=1 Tax=Granulicella mallensis TaxID=940614 RepID=A0A7W7ZPT9_9BACT|nr:hypothetical protein [Granulicella mallensis]MBB5063936.1 hypothetical protein [Granulicella mallensis]